MNLKCIPKYSIRNITNIFRIWTSFLDLRIHFGTPILKIIFVFWTEWSRRYFRIWQKFRNMKNPSFQNAKRKFYNISFERCFWIWKWLLEYPFRKLFFVFWIYSRVWGFFFFSKNTLWNINSEIKKKSKTSIPKVISRSINPFRIRCSGIYLSPIFFYKYMYKFKLVINLNIEISKGV